MLVAKRNNLIEMKVKYSRFRHNAKQSSRELKHQTFFGRRRRLQTSEHGYEGAVVPAKIQT